MSRLILSDLFSPTETNAIKLLMRKKKFEYTYIDKKLNSFSRTYKVADIGYDEIKKFKEKHYSSNIVSSRGYVYFTTTKQVIKRLNWYLHCLKFGRYMSLDNYIDGKRFNSKGESIP